MMTVRQTGAMLNVAHYIASQHCESNTYMIQVQILSPCKMFYLAHLEEGTSCSHKC